MTKYALKLRDISAVAASTTVIIDLPIGPRYHYINLQHGYTAGTNTIAATYANITGIRVKVNNKVQRNYGLDSARSGGTVLRDMNLLNGTGFDTPVATTPEVPNTAPGVTIPLYFAEPWRKNPRDQDALAWSSAGWKSFQIEIDLSTAATPTLVASAVVDDLVVPNPQILKVFRQGITAAGTSFDVGIVDRRDVLEQISLYPDTGATQPATTVTLRKNGDVLRELSRAANRALNLNFGMVPEATGRTAAIYDVVLDHDDLLGSSIPLEDVRTMTLTIESAAAMSGTISAFIHRFGTPE
jgi:hypothetical protein